MQFSIFLLALLCLTFFSTNQGPTVSDTSSASLSTTRLLQRETETSPTVNSHHVSRKPVDAQGKAFLQRSSDEVDETTIDVHPFKFTLLNFPSTDLLHIARIGVLDSLELAHAAMIGLNNLTSSYYRYFNLNDLDLVKQVFGSIVEEPILSNSTGIHTIDVWYDDAFGVPGGCQKGLNVYHISKRAGDTKSSIILCPFLLFRHAFFLDSVTEDEMSDYSNEVMETLGSIILHELIYLLPHFGGMSALDQSQQLELKANPANQLNKGADYSAYLSMKINKDRKGGSQNAANYVFYAAESYFMQYYDLATFRDPLPSGRMNYSPRQPTVEEEGPHSLKRRRVPATDFDGQVRSKIAARQVLPPINLPAPGWPQNFRLVNFPRETGSNENRMIGKAATGLADSWRVVEHAYSVLTQHDPSTSFNRYFQDSDLCMVRRVFRAILDDLDIPSSAPSITGPVNIHRPWLIHYDDSLLPHMPRFCQDASSGRSDGYFAYFDPPNTNRPIIFFCPQEPRYYDRALDGLSCDYVGHRARRENMDSWAALFLHETLHDVTLTTPIIGQKVDDELIDYLGYPVTCYGPWWSYLINIALEFNGAGITNNDNYVYFALEEFFREKCRWDFIDPTMGHDELRDMRGDRTGAQRRHVDSMRLLSSFPSQLAVDTTEQLQQNTSQLSRHETHALRDNRNTAHTNTLVRRVMPPTRLPDGWPQNFVFINFPDEHTLSQAASGLIDMWLVVENGVKSLLERPGSSSFNRYFQADQACFVHSALQALLNAATFAPDADPVLSGQHTWSIYWGDELSPGPVCEFRVLAFYNQLDEQRRDRPAIFLCPQLLHHLSASLPSGLDTYRLENIRCEMLGNKATMNKWMSWAYIFIHESLHDDTLSVPLFGQPIDDQHIFRFGSMQKTYGPYWSFYLNNNFGHLSYLNNDNYVFFLLEEWFSEKCPSKLFVNPVLTGTESSDPWNAVEGPMALQAPYSTNLMDPAALRADANLMDLLQHRSFYSSKSRSLAVTNQTVTANLAVRADVFPPCRPPIADWPPNIIFVNFPVDRPKYIEWAYYGVIDAWALIANVHRALSEKLPSKSFYRYFRAGQECRARRMFARVMDEFFEPMYRPGPVQVAHRGFWNVHFAHLACLQDDTQIASYVYDRPEGAVVALCPLLFGKTAFPYLRRLDSITCDEIIDVASLSRMVNIGGVLLHEMLHNDVMTGSVDGLDLDDIPIQRNGKSYLGYGPWWASYLNKNTDSAILNDENWV